MNILCSFARLQYSLIQKGTLLATFKSLNLTITRDPQPKLFQKEKKKIPHNKEQTVKTPANNEYRC